MLNIVQGITKKPISSQRLLTVLQANDSNEGDLYIGYPIIAAPEGAFSIDALWISRANGLVIFSLVEGADVTGYSDLQDDSANRLETRLRSHRALMRGRQLEASPSIITFAPAASIIGHEMEGYPLCNEENIQDAIDDLSWSRPDLFEAVLSVIQSISNIRGGRAVRNTSNPDSKGSKLKQLEDSIANLDNIQGRAVIETVEGVQRIRGLAGSGKTIILALKAAYLHAQNPGWRIAVTFNTRSLKAQLNRLINTFVIEASGDEPDWSKLQVLNAWGAPGGKDRTGVYFEFVKAHGIEFIDFKSGSSLYGYNDAFTGVCQSALSAAKEDKPLFDVILIDEAQDFDPSFIKMCYSLLSDKKMLVYAYDELQSLTNTSLPPPEELFGIDSNGKPLVHFNEQIQGQPQQDIILEKCYRNSRPVLATAHALGFGIYREPDKETGTGLIQMFDQSTLWEEVGYKVKDGDLEDGKRVCLTRTSESSPLFLESHSDTEDIVQFHVFDSTDEQDQWLASSIEANLGEDELSASDIIVINPNPVKTRTAIGKIRRILYEKNIESHLTGVDSSPDVFFDTDNKSVAFTGIFRAKGNEAGMVYVMNADECTSTYGNIARVRNQLFTAITRSKSWVRVLGVGPEMQALKSEFERVKAADFMLDFVYPTAELRRTMNIINRDKSDDEMKYAKNSNKELRRILGNIKSGKIRKEDLSKETLDDFRDVFGYDASDD